MSINVGRKQAQHQVKLIFGRSHTEMEADINKRLIANTGEYEIKDVNLMTLSDGAWMTVIHYYSYVTVGELGSGEVKKRPAARPTSGTQHIAPAVNTPLSHNEKPKIQPDLNSINNELDKMKAGDAEAKAKTKAKVEPKAKTEPNPETKPNPEAEPAPITESTIDEQELDKLDAIVSNEIETELTDEQLTGDDERPTVESLLKEYNQVKAKK